MSWFGPLGTGSRTAVQNDDRVNVDNSLHLNHNRKRNGVESKSLDVIIFELQKTESFYSRSLHKCAFETGMGR